MIKQATNISLNFFLSARNEDETRTGAVYPASNLSATKSLRYSHRLQQVQDPCPLSGRTLCLFLCLRRHGKWSEAQRVRVKGLSTFNIIDEPRLHIHIMPLFLWDFRQISKEELSRDLCRHSAGAAASFPEATQFHQPARAPTRKNPPQGQQLPN